jgi:hypothetical protein
VDERSEELVEGDVAPASLVPGCSFGFLEDEVLGAGLFPTSRRYGAAAGRGGARRGIRGWKIAKNLSDE